MARQRGRVVLRRIEDRRRRGICFRKRRTGLVKKAEELAVLCDAAVGLLVINPFDGTFQRFAAPATMETIIKRYQNFPEAQKRAHGRRLLKERSKDFQVPLVTTDRKPNIYDVRTIDESSISQLTIEQLTQIERKLEYALRNAKTRKLEAYSIATLHEKGKATLEERDLMEMVSRKEQKQEGGRYVTKSQQRSREVDLTLSLGISIGCNVGCSHRHQRPIDLNMP
ncbi:truncated transcription factor CAULIFLOWER D-like isoform X1 [Hordeum vulgare subsp. vulgare]|uniref:truncated transcription factor CAULIFLOWER D-like isoform X1 n=1 Tax=Hordeum vulgare subsp. vulgare TaxID=112509 RepID=UPI001D1A4810|nr:truncated transcription factor CAULIFLOWER D-like isoform X1 [Hordeum vulgare subsp. vulgare]